MIKLNLQHFTVPTSGTGRIATGIKNVHLAEVLTDPTSGSTTYDTPFPLDGVTDGLDATVNDSLDTYYGDNRAAAQANARGDIDATLSRQQLDNVQEAFIQGNTIVNGFIEDKIDNVPPNVALMFEVTYQDGGSKFVQFDKGIFQEPNMSGATKTDSTEFQSNEYVGKFIARSSDSRRKRSKVVAKASVDAERTTFFADANDVAATALVLTTTPVDAATGVVISADIVLDYNNTMQLATVNNSNVKLIKVSDGSDIALTFTTSDNKIFNGAHADLDAATAYILIVTDNARDVFGQGVEAIINFTTA